MIASLAEPASLRRTPAGLAALRVKVNHESSVVEAGRQRQVRLETEIVAFGEVAAKLAQVEAGRQMKLAGFLDRKGANQIEMHVTEFGIV